MKKGDRVFIYNEKYKNIPEKLSGYIERIDGFGGDVGVMVDNYKNQKSSLKLFWFNRSYLTREGKLQENTSKTETKDVPSAIINGQTGGGKTTSYFRETEYLIRKMRNDNKIKNIKTGEKIFVYNTKYDNDVLPNGFLEGVVFKNAWEEDQLIGVIFEGYNRKSGEYHTDIFWFSPDKDVMTTQSPQRFKDRGELEIGNNVKLNFTFFSPTKEKVIREICSNLNINPNIFYFTISSYEVTKGNKYILKELEGFKDNQYTYMSLFNFVVDYEYEYIIENKVNNNDNKKGEETMKTREIINLSRRRRKDESRKNFIQKSKELESNDKLNQKLRQKKDEIIKLIPYPENLNERLVSDFNQLEIFNFMSDETKEEKLKIKNLHLEELNEIEDLFNEVTAQTSACETYEQEMNVLVNYGIIDNETKKMI